MRAILEEFEDITQWQANWVIKQSTNKRTFIRLTKGFLHCYQLKKL